MAFDKKAGLIIVGGGAAGVASAAFSRGALVLERGSALGRKILVSGGGRCNLSHSGDAETIASAFGRHFRFVLPALSAFPPASQVAWFEALGVPTVVESGGFVFPRSGRASDVRDALLRACEASGAQTATGANVTQLLLDATGSSVCGVELSDGTKICAKAVIVASGGFARPALGTDGSGSRLASGAGIPCVRPVPALSALKVKLPDSLSGIAGLTLLSATLRTADKKNEFSGGLLFTGSGFSGPAALDISSCVAESSANGAVPSIRISWRSDMVGSKIWEELFFGWRQTRGAALVRNLLSGELPRALAFALCEEASIPQDTEAARLPGAQAKKLATLCGDFDVAPVQTGGWAEAMASLGGVSVRAVKPQTLEARHVSGLFFAGEVLEPAGRCGGYNLAWAWASGRLAALEAMRRFG